MRALLVLAAVTACSDPPPLTIKYALRTDGSQVCYAKGIPARSCSDVAMPCVADLDIRIVSPSDSSKQFVKVCQPVPPGRKDLCSIAGIDLPVQAHSLPDDTLEVQVAVYRDDDLPHDEATGDPICPDDLAFSADGLPRSSSPSPAVGGRAFYHPGDTTTVVELGCTDMAAIQDPKCSGMNTVNAIATVSDFDTDVSVSSSLADSLSVMIGEPTSNGTSYSLKTTQLHALDRTVVGPTPGWGANVEFAPMTSACLEVLEDVAEATPTLVCRRVAPGLDQINMNGSRMSKARLDKVLGALTTTQFPPQGLVVGIVLDRLGNPMPDIEVSPPAGDMTTAISYVGSDGKLYGGFTQDTGIFVSRNAPYGTLFTAPASGLNQPSGFGGLVDGKVTVVVLQYNQMTSP